MYYDLIASLPHLPHFERAERLPITRLRLDQRLRLLRLEHAEQLAQARALVPWRTERLLDPKDEALAANYAALMDAPLEPRLREYVAFRMDQQTVLAALRLKQEGLDVPDRVWGAGPRVRSIQKHWDEPDFHLTPMHPWLPKARQLLADGDAQGLEQLLMEVVWRWLDQAAQQGTFSFDAVFSYFFKWEILRARLACDAELGKARFQELAGKVTDARNN